MQRPTPNGSTEKEPDPRSRLSDTALVEKACQTDPSFRHLWAGNTEAYASASEADLALYRKLAFWTSKDAQQMDRLFRQSGL